MSGTPHHFRVIFGLLAVLFSTSAQADLWANFYKSTRPNATVGTTGSRPIGCLEAVVAAQRRFQIPDNILLAIGIQEAGRKINGKISIWPWAVNAEGKGIYFKSREQAISWVRERQVQGVRSIDVGCMQINLHWHKDAFASLEEAFDPVANATYAAQFLSELKRSEGSWWRAAGSYHSRTETHRNRYLSSLSRNQRVANAQIDQLTDDANDDLSRVASPETEALPVPPVMWGVTQANQGRFSIYSRHPITPVLPIFEVGS